MIMRDRESKQRTRVLTSEAQVKRPVVGLWLSYPLYDEVRRASEDEPVKLSAFVLEIFRYGWRVYQRVGSLKELKALETSAAPARIASKRISAERCAMMAEALNLIVERGNSAIIEAVERYLIDKAGKFGTPPK